MANTLRIPTRIHTMHADDLATHWHGLAIEPRSSWAEAYALMAEMDLVKAEMVARNIWDGGL